MGHKEILSNEIESLSTQQAKEILRYVGYIKSLSTSEEQQDEGRKNRRQTILAGFRKLRELGTFDDIEDPAQWQRDIRKDRPLPGR